MSTVVMVSLGRWSDKCVLTGYEKKQYCKNNSKYLVFRGEGTSISNLEASPCEKHLMLSIKRALKEKRLSKNFSNPRECGRGDGSH